MSIGRHGDALETFTSLFVKNKPYIATIASARRLENLLTNNEIATKLTKSESSRWWSIKAKEQFGKHN